MRIEKWCKSHRETGRPHVMMRRWTVKSSKVCGNVEPIYRDASLESLDLEVLCADLAAKTYHTGIRRGLGGLFGRRVVATLAVNDVNW